MKILNRLMALILVAALMILNIPQKAEAAVSVSARSAILMEQDSGRILYEKEANKVRRIASITKIMTAILAIESGKMDETVKVSDQAVRAEGSSIYLQPGEKIKLEDLVYGLMLRSGNDSAVAIAEHIGGSLEGFSFLMNQKAEEIGMKNTHFANPHGLDDHENHYSTAYDMALLTRYAMKNEKYQKIAGTEVHRAPNPNESWDRVWKNKNRLLTELYEYCTGGKTGYTKRAKRTLVTTASKGNLNLIAVTLNGPDDWNDHINMYETAFKNYDVVEILPQGSIKEIEQEFYKNKVYLKQAYSYPVTKEEKNHFKIDLKLQKPKEEWEDSREIPEVVGQATVYFDNQPVKKLPIYYKTEKIKEDKSLLDYFRSLFTTIAGVKKNG
ncbi:D-alanyl-D-alanine carboxypeptidase [Bacillus sp. ISL-47]|uniref:D-alanyl-D-alanine carboxypeptidase family protein n=1 Tax=Bacillus sp. ISL-47 TaxID=2819130 RepID=UPI001BE59B87|nr:D-alanyl-D-alanine carboxypeptidase family protein [Bacillus sp. ISL-47]MBT2686948.1 D-alanyl-D-alanine carboxypeptidase [Bacillus sp. ISL-47]MBT2707752.1 D-alanyl-D-alanine carboxypeptidase [Pseudomonas sp. ISL-84]